MCGRYTLCTDDEYQEIVDIVNEVSRNLESGGSAMAVGEIFPTNAVPVLAPVNGRAKPELFTWGFPNYYSKGVLINARSESVGEKPMFRQCLNSRRCVIPSTGFFEWDRSKQKFQFNLPDTGVLYMAGLYSAFEGENRFVILTTAANQSVADVHNRMPVILPKQDIGNWLFDTGKAAGILDRVPPDLIKKAV